jgi:preprotein translocase subunit SecG
LIYLLYALFILSCITLIASVLLQPGKSDAGALFTSSVSSTAFGPRGTLNILSKITIVAATLFMLSAFLLSQNALTGGRSVLESGAMPAEAPATTGDANANSAVATENAMGANTAASNANAGNANVAASPAANTAPANQAANKN